MKELIKSKIYDVRDTIIIVRMMPEEMQTPKKEPKRT